MSEMPDPFAGAVENNIPEDPTPPEPDTPSTGHPDDGVTSIVATYKGDGSPPWVVVHTTSLAAQNRIRTDPEFKALLEGSQTASAFYGSKYKGRASGGGPAPQGRSDGRPPGVPSMSCAHGERTYKSGKSARGPWEALFCPAEDRESQCKPAFKQKGGTFKVMD